MDIFNEYIKLKKQNKDMGHILNIYRDVSQYTIQGIEQAIQDCEKECKDVDASTDYISILDIRRSELNTYLDILNNDNKSRQLI